MSDTATDASAASSETNAQDQGVQGELDALIAEGTKPKQEQELSKVVQRVDAYVREQETEKFNQRFRSDMDATVKVIQEGIPEDARKLFTPDVIEGHLYKKAEDSQEVKKAWLERDTNPEAWGRVQKQIADDFSKRFEETPDPELTEDREAVAAAAKSQGRQEEELGDNEVMSMSNSDFNALQQKHGVKPYGL